jgi:hypothetical protein
MLELAKLAVVKKEKSGEHPIADHQNVLTLKLPRLLEK